MVFNNKIPAWECACLNKKFIKKEYVKLILKTDIVKLIKNLIVRKTTLNDRALDPKFIWNFVKDVLFTQQIIDFHKITDFKEANKYYNTIKEVNVQQRIDFANQIFNRFFEKNKGQYEYYIKSIKQNE